MANSDTHFTTSSWLFWLIIFLIPLAFFINLGIAPFIDDEGNRALVALEMIWSGNYITPTLHAAYYYNKPPLWNWILTLFFESSGQLNEWPSRIASTLSLLGFAVTIAYFFKRHMSWNKAALGALLFLTFGRILFWESLLGLIDITFSWVVFTLFMLVYHYYEKQKKYALFFSSYLLMTIAFMLKGLPAIVFQGFTILAIITYKEWKNGFATILKEVFSIQHILAGLSAVALLALYYFTYNQYNSLEHIFNALFVESSKRTAVAYSAWDTVKHMLNFPFELFYHFLPWTAFGLLAAIYAYQKKIQVNDFSRYCLLIFGVNIVVYWLSPNFYPRYVLMLLPLLLVPFLQWMPDDLSAKNIFNKGAHILMSLLLVLMPIALAVALFNEDTQNLSYLYLRVLFPVLAIIALAWVYRTNTQARFFVFIAALLVFRIGFNLSVLPARALHSSGAELKTSVTEFAQRWQNKDLAVFYETSMEPAVSFYMESTLEHIIPRHQTALSLDQYYIFSPEQYKTTLFTEKIDSFRVRHRKVDHYYVAKLRTTELKTIDSHTLREPPGF